MRKIVIAIGVLMLLTGMSALAQDQPLSDLNSGGSIMVASAESDECHVTFTFKESSIWNRKNDQDWLNKIKKVEDVGNLFVAGREENDTLNTGKLLWSSKYKMNKVGSEYSFTISLPPGRYAYKFYTITKSIRKVWTLDAENPFITEDGHGNSIFAIEPGTKVMVLPGDMIKLNSQLLGE